MLHQKVKVKVILIAVFIKLGHFYYFYEQPKVSFN